MRRNDAHVRVRGHKITPWRTVVLIWYRNCLCSPHLWPDLYFRFHLIRVLIDTVFNVAQCIHACHLLNLSKIKLYLMWAFILCFCVVCNVSDYYYFISFLFFFIILGPLDHPVVVNVEELRLLCSVAVTEMLTAVWRGFLLSRMCLRFIISAAWLWFSLLKRRLTQQFSLELKYPNNRPEQRVWECLFRFESHKRVSRQFYKHFIKKSVCLKLSKTMLATAALQNLQKYIFYINNKRDHKNCV